MAAARTPPSAHAPREPRWAQMDRHALVRKNYSQDGKGPSGVEGQIRALRPSLSLIAFEIELVTVGHN